MADPEVAAFLGSLRIEAETPFAVPPLAGEVTHDQRWTDIRGLADALRRRVQDNHGDPRAVVLTSNEVAALQGFGTRGRGRHSHRFPVDLDLYTPLVNAEQALVAAVEAATSGYLAVLGPPGSGKSTLLAQVTPGLADRVITYLAYLPGDPAAAGRITAADFLHDLVLRLEDTGLGSKRSLPSRDVNELRTRFRDLLTAAAEDYTHTRKRTLLVVDGLDHVARSTSAQTLLDELPPPDAVPLGVVILLGSQTTTPLDARIRHHLDKTPADGVRRVVDLHDHRLSPAAIAGVFTCVVETTPALTLSAAQVGRVIELVAGHPLALGYVCNALLNLVDDQQAPGWRHADQTPEIPSEDVDSALDRCVRYSGSVADDYAGYLSDAQDSTALLDLLGGLARLRSPLNMRWVMTWADPATMRELARIKHLFRRLDSHSWMFFHDSFRQYVLDGTSVDALGEPDPTVDAQRHLILADECAKAPELSRERGEEFYHAVRAGLDERALVLATPDRFRARFLSGTSPAALREDIRLAMHAAARADNVSALVGLILIQTELRSRAQALESVDVTGLWLDVGDPVAAVAYALPDGVLRVPAQHALTAAVRLDDLDHPAGRLLFDAADVPDLGGTGGSDQWDTLSAWAEGVTRFRPLSVLCTALRRWFERTLAILSSDSNSRDGYDAFATGRFAVYVARCAISELQSAGRQADADEVAGMLRAHVAALVAAAAANSDENNNWTSRLIGAACDHLTATRIERAWTLATAGHGNDALVVLEEIGNDIANGFGRRQRATDAGREYGGQAATIAVRIAVAAFPETARPSAATVHGSGDHASSSQLGQRAAATYDAALSYATALLDRLGPPSSIVSGDLSPASDRPDALEDALRIRSSHMIMAGLRVRAAGQPLTDDMLFDALPTVAGPPANQPAGAWIDPTAGAHRNQQKIEYAAQIDKAITILAVLNAATALGGMPAAALRSLVTRVLTVLPHPPADLSTASSVRPHHTRFLKMLIDVVAHGSDDIMRFLAEQIGLRTSRTVQAAPPGDPAGSATYGRRLRQRLGLRLLARGVRPDWLDNAIADVDAEVANAPGAFERLEVLATQVTAHAKAGDLAPAHHLLARVMPESFGGHWRSDNQLEEWIRWLLLATDGNPDLLLAESADLAPLLAALTDATDGSASAAGAILLAGVAHAAPRHAVRLAAWQLGEGALSFTEAHEALLAGFADAIMKTSVSGASTTEAADDAIALLGATLAGIVAPLSTSAPTRALERMTTLLARLAPHHADAIREQLARAVDMHVLPSSRQAWRGTLRLPPTSTSACDEAAIGSRETTAPSRTSQDWGESDYGRYKGADGTINDPDTIRREIVNLADAFAWRSQQGSPGTFAWLPVLQPFVARASRPQLDQIVEKFTGVYDEAAILVAVAQRMQEIGATTAAEQLARRALAATEPSAWSGHLEHATRRRAWKVLATCSGDTTRRQAIQDLTQLLTSADHWPSTIMLELRKILPVIAPQLPAAEVWPQIRRHLDGMRSGVTEPEDPVLDGPVRAAWWAPSANGAPAPANKAAAASTELTEIDICTSVGNAVVELLLLHLDHPTWAVREDAAATLAWLLRAGGPHAAFADAQVCAILAGCDEFPILVTALRPDISPNETPSSGAAPTSTSGAAPAYPGGAGLSGDGVREMAARAIAAAAKGTDGVEALSAIVSAARTSSWIPTDCVRSVHPDAEVPVPYRTLPAAYRLAFPMPPGNARLVADPADELGPYHERAQALATAADIAPNTVLHRVRWFADQAEQLMPSSDSINRAARATQLDRLYSGPRAQAVRAAFGRVVSELAASGRIQVDDPEVTAALELVDIDLVRQPLSPAPPWIPIPTVYEWIPGENWLRETADRLSSYETNLAFNSGPGEGRHLALRAGWLDGPAVDFGPIAAVIGAEHELIVTDQGHHTERYLLASTFQRRLDPLSTSLSPLLIPATQTKTIRMTSVEDWLLRDGTRLAVEAAKPESLSKIAGLPLIIWTDSTALHTNDATWICLDPRIAAAHNWRPHPWLPLCWQDHNSELTAASVLWRRASFDVRRGNHDTVGRGSMVIVSQVGLNALLATAPIGRTHQVTRTVKPSEYGGALTKSRKTAVAELAILPSTIH